MFGKMMRGVKSVGRNVGESLGLVKTKAGDAAGTRIFDELQRRGYEYQPESFQLGPVSSQDARAARQEMAGFGQALRRRAMGEVPSQAEMQLQAGTQRAQQSLQAALAGMRGRQAGLGIRGLQQQFAEQGQTLSQQAAQLRAAEQATAEQQLAQFLAQRANLEREAQATALQEAMARQQAAATLEERRGMDQLARQQLAITGAAGAQERQQKGVGSFLSGAGSLIGKASTFFSDENVKTDIEPAKQEAKKFLDELTAYTFKYKNDNEPMMGVMAQDAEKSKLGKYIVNKKSSPKSLDGKKTLSAVLASLAFLNDRLNQMENKS